MSLSQCETLGIRKSIDLITVVSLYDPIAGVSKVLRFVDLNYDGDVVYTDNVQETIDELVGYLDSAETLISFNGTAFDIPFIQLQFKIPNEKAQQWAMKNFDILEICRKGFQRTFNLNSALALNGVGDGKTGSGLEAVHQAQRGDWDDLCNYCLDDSKLTYELSMLPVIYCCEGFKWRKAHGERTHDPANVLIIHNTWPDFKFSYGPLPGYTAPVKVEDVLSKRKSPEIPVELKCEGGV
jgi:hypothetical protein